MQQGKIMIAKRNPLCYNAFAMAVVDGRWGGKTGGFWNRRPVVSEDSAGRGAYSATMAAWRNGRRTALKMRRETVSVQVRLPLLNLPGITPGRFSFAAQRIPMAIDFDVCDWYNTVVQR